MSKQQQRRSKKPSKQPSQQRSKQPNQQRSKPRSKQVKKKERGGWLTAAIILIIIHGILLLGVAFGENSYLRQVDLPNWYYPALGVAALADIIAGVALWLWKGWGFYLYLASIAIVIVIGLLITGSLLFAFSAIIPFAIVGYIMRPKWEFFS